VEFIYMPDISAPSPGLPDGRIIERSEGTASLEKALDVLDAIGTSPQGLSQVELAERLRLPRTTLYRLLASLTARELIRRDPVRRVYCLGFKCFEFARKAHSMPDLAAAANFELRALRDLTGETSYLAILDGSEVLGIERIDGAHSHRSNSALGQRKPLHCTSQGKAILSALPTEQRDKLIKSISLKPVTEFTITDKRRLLAELKITTARGYSIDDEEIVKGIRCVGAPIIDSAGQVRGAMSVAGPAFRMTRERLEILGPEVADAARRVGAELVVQNDHTLLGEPIAIEGPWAFYGQFPCWSRKNSVMFWVDSLAPTIRICRGQLDEELLKLDHPVTGLTLLAQDTLLISFAQGFVTIEKPAAKHKISALTPWTEGKPTALTTNSNGKLFVCLPFGEKRFRVGSWEPGGIFEPLWSINQKVDYLAWSADEETLYGLNSADGEIILMQHRQQNVRRLAHIPKGSGTPCGLAVDRDGGVWTALKDGWGIVRLHKDGSIDKVVSLPVPCPTDLAIGFGEEEQIFVTTARQSLSVESVNNAPLSGQLFTVSLRTNDPVYAV
jgi:IclR family transcriptional regulator, acetate operon repressor